MRLAGTLLVSACNDVLERAREVVARQFESPLEAVTVNAGKLHHLPSGDVLSVQQVATLGDLTAAAEMNGRLPAFPTGCAVCEIEVDPQSGAVTILRYTQIDDVGQAINPLIVHGQTHGGIAQGVGQALSEYFPIDDESGRLLGTSFMDYAVPRAADLPALDVHLVEDPTFGNPLRVKGAGEGGVTPAPAAVINALADALAPLGIEHVEMPATPPRVWAAIARACSK
jgi:carbon-monoxide dehydrogenase large subunit